MAEVTSLDDMGGDEVLAFAGDAAERRRSGEVDELRAAYKWAVIHSPERLDPQDLGRPGRERPGSMAGTGRRRSPSSPPRRSVRGSGGPRSRRAG